MTAQRLHNFIRGLDSSPGAWTVVSLQEPKDNEADNWQEIRLYGSQLYKGASIPSGQIVYLKDNQNTGILWDNGLLLPGQDGHWVTHRLF